MNIDKHVKSVEAPSLRVDLPPFRPGDTVRVHVKVREAEKERLQVFEGIVLRRRAAGLGSTFTVRKVSYGVGVERTFPLHSRDRADRARADWPCAPGEALLFAGAAREGGAHSRDEDRRRHQEVRCLR